jgi:ubiquinone/menaquinone biosynthesis C-methylase UbiE
LDVGCGTGNSTIALLPYAKWVVGLDSASAMIAQAPLHPRVDYRKGYAEALPFRAASFDLVTVCSAYHWFDHERFLAEAARVLKARGWLALYKIGSMGHALDNSSFASWKKDIFRSRFPKVARNDAAMDEATAQQFGFEPCACEQLRFAETYTLERYLDNLLTHSSVIRVVDSGAGQLAQTRSWLRDQLSAFFGAGELTFEHEASIHILRKI